MTLSELLIILQWWFFLFFIGFVGLGCGSECGEVTISILDKIIKYLPYSVILVGLLLSYLLLNIIAKNSQNRSSVPPSKWDPSVPRWRRMSVAQLVGLILLIPAIAATYWAAMK